MTGQKRADFTPHDLRTLLATAALLGTTQLAAADPPDQVGVGCDRGGCGAGAYAAGYRCATNVVTPVNSSNTAGSGANADSTSSDSSPIDPGACVWKALPTAPPAGSSLWAGNDPAAGYIEYTNCLSTGVFLRSIRTDMLLMLYPEVAPAAPPPPNPGCNRTAGVSADPDPETRYPSGSKSRTFLSGGYSCLAVDFQSAGSCSGHRYGGRSLGHGHTGFDVGVVVDGRAGEP